MGDHMIDVVQRNTRGQYFAEQQWGVRHRRPLDAPGIGEHSRRGSSRPSG